MYGLYWKVSRYAIFCGRKHLGKRTRKAWHICGCVVDSPLSFGALPARHCVVTFEVWCWYFFHSWNPLLWQLLIILVWFFLDFCNNFDLIPELSLPRNLFLMSQSMEIKNFRFWDNTAIKSVDHFIWNFEGLIQVSFRGIPVQFCFWYSRLSRHMTQSVLGFLRETICGKGRTLGDLLRCQATIPLYQQSCS